LPQLALAVAVKVARLPLPELPRTLPGTRLCEIFDPFAHSSWSFSLTLPFSPVA
jgi:hypothetical protein